METLIRFWFRGRFAHFLKAESGVTALTYPVPPRTAVMGLIGAILGIQKDEPQSIFRDIGVTVEGKLAFTHWHRAKLRKDPPNALPQQILATQSGQEKTKPEQATLIRQEWLFNPEYLIGVSLPEPYSIELEDRLKKRKWHFPPCLGLSEMSADLEYEETVFIKKLPKDNYIINGLIRREHAKLDIKKMYEEKLSLQILRMPRQVTPDRVFEHAGYLFEMDGRPVPVETAEAFGEGGRAWLFL